MMKLQCVIIEAHNCTVPFTVKDDHVHPIGLLRLRIQEGEDKDAHTVHHDPSPRLSVNTSSWQRVVVRELIDVLARDVSKFEAKNRLPTQ
jgi:hypothetical protein